MLLVRDWWISIHFACFCFWMTVTIMIDDSVKRNNIVSLALRETGSSDGGEMNARFPAC